jgi:LPXTG-motif cell wall-anchored protein
MKSLYKIRLVALVLSVVFAMGANAQVQTSTSTTTGNAVKEVQVERGEVVTVAGNDLVVKMEDGTIRHFANVPESTRVTVDGKQLGIHDLKPGMKLQRTITTTTTPKTITTVQTVAGKVWYVNPPNSVILTMENGENQSFKIPNGQKFDVDGQMVDAFGLKKGMNVKATKIVEVPETVIAKQKSLTGTMPPNPTPPPADAPLLIATKEPVSQAAPTTTAQATPAPAKLPKTGSEWPLIGFIGLALIAVSLAIKFVRVKLGV